MRKFPDINQFRHTVDAVTRRATYIGSAADGSPVYDASRLKPVLTFTGTTKLHGSNAGIAFDLNTNAMSAQSRERVLSLEADHANFCAWSQSDLSQAVLQRVRGTVEALWGQPAQSIHVFGEWCGPGVNGKTGIGQLPERFVIFAALVTDLADTEFWLDLQDVALTFYANNPTWSGGLNFICEFQQWTMAIDFNDPGAALDELERLTMEVEASCPVAKALGGDGIGEGIVWICQDPDYGRLVFKTKGTKHKGTKAARLVSIAPEVLESRAAFVAAVLTESRLEQGFELIRATHGKVTADSLGEFLLWVGSDVLKEESDTLKASGLKRKDVMGDINRHAKAWVTPRLARF